MHQIIGVGDIAPEMNAQFQDGKCLGTRTVDNSPTPGVPTSLGETPSFALQEGRRVCLLAQAINVHGSGEKAVLDAIQQFCYLPAAEFG